MKRVELNYFQIGLIIGIVTGIILSIIILLYINKASAQVTTQAHVPSNPCSEAMSQAKLICEKLNIK